MRKYSLQSIATSSLTDTFGDLIKGNCSHSGGGGWLLTVFGWLLLGDTSILATHGVGRAYISTLY